MQWTGDLQIEQFILFSLVLSRVGGLTMTAPIYAPKAVPMQVRIFLAVALALLITPTQLQTAVSSPSTTLNFLLLLSAEALIGLSLGLGLVVLFSGAQLAGGLVGRVGGLALADVFDPDSQASVPVLSQLILMVTLAVFVCIGGHRMVMASLLDTFQTIPPGAGAVPNSVAQAFVLLVRESFILGVRAAVPILAALLLSIFVLGVIGRTMPQMNMLMVGFGLNTMLLLAVLSLSLGMIAWMFQDRVESTLDLLLKSIHTPLSTPWLSS